MSEQPSMAHLAVEEPPDDFDILHAQRDLQHRIKMEGGLEYDPEHKAHFEKDMLASFRFNVEAIDAEWEEIKDRLPWKAWKYEHRGRLAASKALSDDDRLEIKYELVDVLHFLVNMMISAGFRSWTEVESLYWAKNRENFDRQERGY